jgi:cholesterol transport system auxiliary component
MHRTTRVILMFLLSLCVAGCGSGRPIRYYTSPVAVAPTLTANPYPFSILVGNVAGPEIFEDTPIAYRIGTNEIGTYEYSRWIEPPVQIVQAGLVRMLRASGDYQSVAMIGAESQGQYIVRGRLHDFEEVDNQGITTLVSMDFELLERKSGRVVWTHYYSQSEPVQGKDISGVVTALNANLDRGLKEVAAGLGEYFAAHSPKKS